MLIHLWQQGTLAQAFIAVSVIAVGLLAAVFARLAARQLDADSFITQINKLLAADNLERATRLAHAGAPRPVAQVVHIGLASWQGGTSAAREEMQRRAPEVLADSFRGLSAALAAGAAALGLGGVLLFQAKGVQEHPLIIGPMALIGVLFLMTVTTSGRMRLDVTKVTERLGM